MLDELKEIDGLTPAMLVALGEAGIKTVEDLAGCATDELIGWTERKAGGAVKHKGAFSDLDVAADEANDLIMKARIKAGWIEAPVEPEAEDQPARWTPERRHRTPRASEADQPLADRMCIVTREVKDEADLIRFVRSPDGVAVPDLARKLPGRGVWVSLDRKVLAEAVRKKLFSRGFAAETTMPPDLPDMVSDLLRQQALSLLSLAKKAGEAVSGFMKVEEMLGRGRARLLFHGTDAAPDGCRKLDKLAAARASKESFFSNRRELDLAFGRSNVVHAAVAKGGLAEKLSAAVRRIEMFEGLRAAHRGPEERR